MVDARPMEQKNKGVFSEEDVCDLQQRYSAMQVLALLREVAQSEVKNDWNAMVMKTETGITNAREFQLLWRHIAYRHPLAEKVQEGDQPLDDDSDFEYELEPSPPVSTEFSTEVANCVKVLAFGTANESSMPIISTVESDMPNGHSSKPASENRHPASLLHSSNTSLISPLQKQLQAAGPSGHGFDNNYPPRGKRKLWSEDEDLELVASVKKFGESNWTNIVKGEFKGDRTASQLSQRWQIIKKRKLGLNVASASSTEVQLATRRAIDMALKDNLATGYGTVSNGDAANNNNPNPNAVDEAGGVMGIKALPRPPIIKAGPTKPLSVSDSIQAAAVAAGARIASPLDAANILKATQSKNAVRIMGGGTSLIKSTSPTGSSPLHPNVHFIQTGLTANSTAKHAHIPKAKNPPSSTAKEPKQVEQKTSNEVKVPVADIKPVVEVRGAKASLSSKCLLKAPGSSSKDTAPSKPRVDGDNARCKKLVGDGGYFQKVEASNDKNVKSEPMDLQPCG